MEYLTLAGQTHAEIEVRRSRFLAVVRRAETTEQARELVALQRQAHHDAGHHCSAFVLGSPASSGTVTRSHDDGEPSGTAGMPILQVLLGSGLTDVAAVVTRWFGGTLLGTGGLARAYADATSQALSGAQLVRRRRVDLVRLAVDHASAGRVEAALRARGVGVDGVEYGSAAVITVFNVDEDGAESAGAGGLDTGLAAVIAAVIAAVTGGTGRPEAAGHRWVDLPVS